MSTTSVSFLCVTQTKTNTEKNELKTVTKQRRPRLLYMSRKGFLAGNLN